MWKIDPVKLKVSVLNVIVTCCRWFLSSVLVCVWLPGTAIQRRSPVGRYFTLKSSFLFPDLSLIYTFCCFDVLCPVFLPVSVVPSSLCAQCMRVFLLLHIGFIVCLLSLFLLFCVAVELSFVHLNTALWSCSLISPVVVLSSFRMSTPSISHRTPESSTCRTSCTWRTGTSAALALCFCE